MIKTGMAFSPSTLKIDSQSILEINIWKRRYGVRHPRPKSPKINIRSYHLTIYSRHHLLNNRYRVWESEVHQNQHVEITQVKACKLREIAGLQAADKVTVCGPMTPLIGGQKRRVR